jgi:SAM-dependent methyltransferase
MARLSDILNMFRDDPEMIFTPSAREIFLDGDHRAENLSEKEFRFYSSVKLPNGVTKKTSQGRLRALDEWLLPHLPKEEKKLEILDLGISAGVTTVELAEALNKNELNFHITGADLYITAYLLIAGERESVLLDREGNPIHYELDGRGIGYSLGKNIFRRMRISGLRRFALNWLRRYGKQLAGLKEAGNIGGFIVQPVLLLCRAVIDHPEISVIEADIFGGGIAGKFGLARAANLLNLAYFPAEKISPAIENIKNILLPGGLFLAARTEMDDTTNATLFRLSDAGNFEIIDRFGGGSELEELVLR